MTILNANISINWFNKKIFKLYLNSTVILIVAFLSIFLPYQILTMITASWIFDVPTSIHHLKIIFLIPDNSRLWTYFSVCFIYAAGPIYCLVCAIYLLRYLIKNKFKEKNAKKTYYLWCYIIAVNLFFGGLFAGTPIMKGFGYVPWWALLPGGLRNLITIISAICLIANGIFLNSIFSAFAYNYRVLMDKYSQILFKTVFVLLPVLTFNLILLITGLPDNTLYERLLLVTIFFQIIPILPFSLQTIQPKEQNELFDKISIKYIKYMFILIALVSIFFIIKYFLLWHYFKLWLNL